MVATLDRVSALDSDPKVRSSVGQFVASWEFRGEFEGIFLGMALRPEARDLQTPTPLGSRPSKARKNQVWVEITAQA